MANICADWLHVARGDGVRVRGVGERERAREVDLGPDEASVS